MQDDDFKTATDALIRWYYFGATDDVTEES